MKTTNGITLANGEQLGKGDEYNALFSIESHLTNLRFVKCLTADANGQLQQIMQGTWYAIASIGGYDLRILKPGLIPIGTTFMLYYPSNILKVNDDVWIGPDETFNDYGVLVKISTDRWMYRYGAQNQSGIVPDVWKTVTASDTISIGCGTNYTRLIIMQ